MPTCALNLPRLVVFDLDDTVWTVSEGLCSLLVPPFRRTSPDRIETREGCWAQLKPGVRKFFEFLKKEGCYISIVSRNEPQPAKWLLMAFGLYDYVDFPQFGWGPKAETIQRTASFLGIKLDEVMFFDDWTEHVKAAWDIGVDAYVVGESFPSYVEFMEQFNGS